MQQLVSSLSALVVRSFGLLGLFARALLLLNYDSVAIRVFLSCLKVRGEKELLENLSNEVLLSNDSVTDSLVSLGDDLASEGDESHEHALLLSGKFHGSCIILGLSTLSRSLHGLLLLDLVDSLVEELLRVVNWVRSVCTNALQSILLRLHVNELVKELKELAARLV